MKAPLAGEEIVAEVMRLHYTDGLGVRAIARRLSIARNTVRRILNRRPKRTPERARRASLLDPYLPQIKQWVDDTPELKATAILERLRGFGFTGGITIVRDEVRKVRPREAKAFLTLDFAPGSMMQVDWADFGYALPGCPRRVSAFVAVLAYSRHLYLEFTMSQAFGSFVRCMDRALSFFGGTTTLSLFDNMKTVVLSHTPLATRFHRDFLEFARVRGGFGVAACNPRSPHEKGRVERPIGFVRERFWQGAGSSTCSISIDKRRRGATSSPIIAFTRRPAKFPPSSSRMTRSCCSSRSRQIRSTPMTENPPASRRCAASASIATRTRCRGVSSAQSVLVRGNDQMVSVFLDTKQVALHVRSWGIGDDVEDRSHRRPLEDHRPRARAGVLPAALAELGESGTRYFAILAAGRRSIHREAVRLVLLVELFGPSATRSAMVEVMATGHVGAEYIEYVLRHKRGLTPHPEPLRIHVPELEGVRLPEPDLSQYDRPRKLLDPHKP